MIKANSDVKLTPTVQKVEHSRSGQVLLDTQVKRKEGGLVTLGHVVDRISSF